MSSSNDLPDFPYATHLNVLFSPLEKIELDPLAERETRLKDRESQQMAFLAAEQNKLHELNEKLNELEREFDEQAAAEKPAPERKKR